MKSDLMGELSMLVVNGAGQKSPHWQVNVATALAEGRLQQFETENPVEVKSLTVELVNRYLTYVTAYVNNKWVIRVINNNKKEDEKNGGESEQGKVPESE